jgi:hypothetical protein
MVRLTTSMVCQRQAQRFVLAGYFLPYEPDAPGNQWVSGNGLPGGKCGGQTDEAAIAMPPVAHRLAGTIASIETQVR